MATIWHIYSGTVGNAGAYIDALQKAAKQAKIKSHAFVSWHYEYTTEGITKYFFPVTDGIPQRNRFLKCLRGIELVIGNILVWIFAAFKRPVVGLHMAGSFPPTFLLFCLCKLVGLKTYVTCHDVEENNLYMSKARMMLLKNSDKLIVHSSVARKLILNYLGQSSNKKILQYSFPFSSYNSILSVEGLQNAEKCFDSILPVNKDYFLFLGPRECKGISTLIEAWEKTDAKEKCNLLIAGKWVDVSREVRERASQLEGCIIFEQYLTNEEFVFFIEKAKFVLLPYLNYSHSSVLISCARHNGAVIISDIELFDDYFSDYELRFPSGESDSLAALLSKAASMDNSDVVIQAEKLRKSVESNDEQLVSQLASAYCDNSFK